MCKISVVQLKCMNLMKQDKFLPDMNFSEDLLAD